MKKDNEEMISKWFDTFTMYIISATSWENLFKPYENNKGADQPAQPRSLISTLVFRYLDSTIPILAKSKISRLYLVSVAEQAGLSPTWSGTPKTDFLVTAHIIQTDCQLHINSLKDVLLGLKV